MRRNSPRTTATALLAGLLACSQALAGQAVAPAPDFALKALDGYNYRLSEYRGEVVALVFWASWCGGCRRELGRLQALANVYGEAGLQVLGITVDEKPEAARSVAAAVGASFPQLLDSDKSVSSRYRPEALPTVLLIDRSGAVRFRYGELEPDQDRSVVERLRMLLDE